MKVYTVVSRMRFDLFKICKRANVFVQKQYLHCSIREKVVRRQFPLILELQCCFVHKQGKSCTHYEVLGLERTATEAEIKAAYFQLSKLYHPDRNKDPSANRKFNEINEARQVLGNPDRRFLYDSELKRKDSQRTDNYQHSTYRYYKNWESDYTSDRQHYESSQNKRQNRKGKGSDRSFWDSFGITSPLIKAAIIVYFIFVFGIVSFWVRFKMFYLQNPVLRKRNRQTNVQSKPK